MKTEKKRKEPANRRTAQTTLSEAMASEPSEADIRMRAYWRFLQRGAADGMDFDDWLAAEKDLKQKPGM